MRESAVVGFPDGSWGPRLGSGIGAGDVMGGVLEGWEGQ